MEALSDWTKSPDPGIRFYSGAARYAGSLVVPPAEGVHWTLDLGDLYEIGVLGNILRMVRQSDEKTLVLIQIVERVLLQALSGLG